MAHMSYAATFLSCLKVMWFLIGCHCCYNSSLGKN